MVSTGTTELEQQPISLTVERGGRRFPSTWRAATPRVPNRIRQLQERKEDDALPRLLDEAITEQLPWSAVSSRGSDRQQIVEAYVKSLERLAQCRSDVDRLVRAACEANLEFRQGAGETHAQARDAALQRKLDELLAKAAGDWLPSQNVLNARTVSQPVDVLRIQLDAALTQAVCDFSRQFFELLAKLVDQRLFGLVEWLPNHCVGYHFFKQVVIQDVKHHSETASQKYFDRPDRDVNDWDESAGAAPRVIGSTTTRTVTTGTHQQRLARHEHSVMNAVQTTIGNSRVVMPPEVRRLVERVPAWLYPFVSVIDGDLFRERIVEQDVKLEEWTDVQVRDEPIFGCEPAVIIGPYVLTGWGPREVRQEQDRRSSAQESGLAHSSLLTSARRAPLFVAAAVVLSLIALLLMGRAMNGSGGAVFVVLASLAAIGCAWQAALDFTLALAAKTKSQ